MANSFLYKDKDLGVGTMINVAYKIKEGDKERIQNFEGIIIKIRGEVLDKMFTVRKMSKSGIGIERIFNLQSPFISDIKIIKKSKYQKAKAYFIRGLSAQKLKEHLYKS